MHHHDERTRRHETDGCDAVVPVEETEESEGRVRVVFDPRKAQLLPGEILVCPGTDPSWTPLFLTSCATVSVMLRNPRRPGTSNQR